MILKMFFQETEAAPHAPAPPSALSPLSLFLEQLTDANGVDPAGGAASASETLTTGAEGQGKDL